MIMLYIEVGDLSLPPIPHSKVNYFDRRYSS